MYASSRAALRFYAELAPKTPVSTIRELLNRAEDGDRKAIEALSRQAMFLGQGLRLISTALSPELILLTGDLTISWARFGPIVEAELNGKMLAGVSPRLMVTTDAELARLRGAAALVLQRHSGYHRSTPSSTEEHRVGKSRNRSKREASTATR
jgi:predicted NBD/HSP70 family sugar kinase